MESSIPWTEKYRPKKLNDLMLDEMIMKQVDSFIRSNQDVHLIITGMPGVGKTSTVRCIAKKFLKKNIEQGYLELNAAEDRGSRSISSIIPPFCKRIVDFEGCKIILFDEADNMTSKCQYDINSMIKVFGKKTRFIFTCNDSSKIIEDIQSVCRIIRFKNLTKEQIKKYLEKICIAEGIDYDNSGLDTICYISEGDMRKSINDLQKTAFTFEKITKKTVLTICKIPDPDEIIKILNTCIKKDLVTSNEYLTDIISQGYDYLDIINGFINVLTNYDICEKHKLQLIDIANNTKIIVSTGLKSKLQLTAMICRLIDYISKNDIN
jgi:replication factor C subunit 2/4